MNAWDKFVMWFRLKFTAWPYQFKTTDEIKVWWRLWSIRLGIAGTTVTSALVAVPEWAQTLWNSLPYEVRQFIPPQYMPLVGVALFVMSMAARFIQQRKTAQILAEKKAAAVSLYRAEIARQNGPRT